MPSWNDAAAFLGKFGIIKGGFVLFFFMAHYWVWKMYNGRLEDRQKEIDRLASDNREYRERFLAITDQAFNVGPSKAVRGTRKKEEAQ